MTYINRRGFLGSAASIVGTTSLLSAIGSGNAWAQTANDYKAIVCIFLAGGLDSADTVLPYDQASYDAFRNSRQGIFADYESFEGGASGSSRSRENLLPLNVQNSVDFGGRQFALPRQMSELRDIFNNGNGAIIGNVGPIIRPTTRNEFESRSVPLPQRLFSHNDQQSTWQSLSIEGAQLGWGGRMSDAALTLTGQDAVFSSISVSGNPLFLAGENTRPFMIDSNGVSRLSATTRREAFGNARDRDALRQRMAEYFENLATTNSSLLDQDVVSASNRAIENNERYLLASESIPTLPTGGAFTFPDTRLGGQLRTIAETIANHGALGVNRQVLFAQIGGFDTHSNSARDLPSLQRDISQSISAFLNVLEAFGMQDEVVTFTASEFGRTIIENGDGTDHGWGGHQLVFGGPVNGGRIYGDIPSFDLGQQSYTARSGRLIPTVAVDQFAATLSRWFGLPEDQINSVLPNLSNFSEQDVGFLSV